MTSSISALECIICYEKYDTKQRKPCIGQCGHSICESCKHQLTTPRCPQCNREEAFVITIINYQVLKIMETFNSLSKYSQLSSEERCSECGEVSKRLRLCQDCGLCHGILVRRKELICLRLNGLTVEKAVHLAKDISICGDCVFENHDGHDTMKFTDLKQILLNDFECRTRETMRPMKISLDNFGNLLETSYNSTNQLMETSNGLSDVDRKPHYSKIGFFLHKMSTITGNVSSAMYRLQSMVNTWKERITYFERTGRVPLRNSHNLENAGSFIAVEQNDGVDNNYNKNSIPKCSKCSVPGGRLCLCVHCQISNGVVVRRENIKLFILNLEKFTVRGAVRRINNSATCENCISCSHGSHNCMQFSDMQRNLDDIIQSSLKARIDEIRDNSQETIGSFITLSMESEKVLKNIFQISKKVAIADEIRHFSNIESDLKGLLSINISAEIRKLQDAFDKSRKLHH